MKHSELEKQYSLKNDRVFSTLTPGSEYYALWVCDKNHEYQMKYSARVKGQGCPYCAGKKVLAGFNDLATTHPGVASQWHPNNPYPATACSAGSGKKVKWVCNKGHEWEATVYNRTSGTGCPYCAGKKAYPGFNDLTTTHPQLTTEWHPVKNNGKHPIEYMAGSRTKVWWQCSLGHEWEAIIHSRAIAGTNCPYCAGKKVLNGYNDITTTHSFLLNEWSTRNLTTPMEHSKGEQTKVWWTCVNGHEWETSIKTRTENKNCPECAATSFASKPEKEIAKFLEQNNQTLILNSRNIIQGELDVYVPEKQVAVEFNGLYWHSEKFKPKNYHYDKWKACADKGIQLIQIWEDDWYRNPELVKRMLTHKLGLANETIYARKTSIVSLTYKEATDFLNLNHIQQGVKGTHYLGLTYQNNLVAVMVITLKNNVACVERYATSQPVAGGFTKLLNQVEKTYTLTTIETFSDHTVSNGGLYEKNGFTAVKELKPDYMYIVNAVRRHKFGYRLKKFKNNPFLCYEEGLTETELAKMNGLQKIWDAGKTKWVKKLR